MATSSASVSMEQYLRTSYSPDVDYVDGEIQERNLGEFEHARLTGLFFAYFYAQEKQTHAKALVEQRIRVTPDRVRICDFVLLRPGAQREDVTQTPPLLCIEILSPEDRLARATLVLEDYLRMGVPHIWLVDPLHRVTYTFDENGHHEHEGALNIPELNVSLDMYPMFADLDEE